MTELLVFGGDSLVGSHFVGQTQHTVALAGRRRPEAGGPGEKEFISVDLRRPDAVRRVVESSRAEVVINFSAATDVDAVERERPTSSMDVPSGDAFTVNALAPEAMAIAARTGGRSFISISTDFVFDGTAGPYPESARADSLSHHISWYGWTKGDGERRIRTAEPAATIVRIAYPYRTTYPDKLDFARRIIDQARKGTLPPMFADQQITPTWIPDVSRALERLIAVKMAGVVHVASPQVTSPLQFAHELLSVVHGRPPRLEPGSLEAFLARPGSVPRPLRGGLLCSRLPSRGIPLTSWLEGIRHFSGPGGD